MIENIRVICMAAVCFLPTFGLVASSADGVGESARVQAEKWLKERALVLGWNPRQRVIVSMGSYMDNLFARNGDYAVIRDEGYFTAYRTMLINMLKVVRQEVSLREMFAESERRSIDSSGEGIIEEIFKDIVRPWSERNKPRFVWRYCGVEDDSGKEIFVEFNRDKVRWSSDMKSTLEGPINGLQSVRYFESRDSEDNSCEFAVIGVQNVDKSGGFVNSFENGDAVEGCRGNLQFGKWLAEQDVNTLMGTHVYCDGEGIVWVLGVAPVVKGDLSAARERARLWSSFAFGGYVHAEYRLLRVCKEGIPCYYEGRREVLDARQTVVGQSYPEGLCQYHLVKGRLDGTGEDCSVVVCVLPSGTHKFRQQEFDCALEKQVRKNYVKGKLKSVETAEKVVRERLRTLSGTEQEKKRKALLDMLTEIENVKKSYLINVKVK